MIYIIIFFLITWKVWKVYVKKAIKEKQFLFYFFKKKLIIKFFKNVRMFGVSFFNLINQYL